LPGAHERRVPKEMPFFEVVLSSGSEGFTLEIVIFRAGVPSVAP
jgi:hypothetical protein